MNDSILNTMKTMLGYDADSCFDTELIVHINSFLAVLNQLGVGPVNGFTISGPAETWYDFLYTSPITEFVKTYLYLKLRLTFDPPQNGSVLSAFKEQIPELEWRIVAANNTAENNQQRGNHCNE